VPNCALLEDQVKHSEDLGLQTAWWSAQNHGVDEDTQLVFLAMESATSLAFKK
jgi:hypothetical protein